MDIRAIVACSMDIRAIVVDDHGIKPNWEEPMILIMLVLNLFS
jgi:hypothetical protein